MTYPKNILFEKWADIGFSWEGDVPVREFARLADCLNLVAQDTHPNLAIKAVLSKKDGTVWLDFAIKGVLCFDCHRCLDVMTTSIDDKHQMAIVCRDDEIASLEQQEADYVLWSEVSLDGRMLPLFDVIEDELLLSLPLSSTHADCQMSIDMTDDLPVSEVKENPFAILASLKA